MRVRILSILLIMAFSAGAQSPRATLQAAGLTCAMCSNAIYQSLIRLPFVEDVSPDLKNSAFIITFRSSKTIDPMAMRRVVEDAGFSIARLSWPMRVTELASLNNSIYSLQGMNLYIMNPKKIGKSDSVELVMIDKEFLTKKKYKQYWDAVKNIQQSKASLPGSYHAWVESVEK